MTHDL
jgi:hypothetical protein